MDAEGYLLPFQSCLHLIRLLLLPVLPNKASSEGNRFSMESQAQKKRKERENLLLESHEPSARDDGGVSGVS